MKVFLLCFPNGDGYTIISAHANEDDAEAKASSLNDKEHFIGIYAECGYFVKPMTVE